MNNPFTAKQTKQIIDGFIDYRIKLNPEIKKAMIQTLPTRGVWLGQDFFSESEILKPFIIKYEQLKKESNDE